MQSKMVFKICDGTSSLFYAEEFNVIVHERYFPCITLLHFWPFCIPNYQRTWWLGWELGIVTRSYYGRIASVIGVWHHGDQCSIHSVMTIFIKKMDWNHDILCDNLLQGILCLIPNRDVFPMVVVKTTEPQPLDPYRMLYPVQPPRPDREDGWIKFCVLAIDTVQIN